MNYKLKLTLLIIVLLCIYQHGFTSELKTGLKVSAEYDDNVNLANDRDQKKREETIVHLIPSVEWLNTHKEHQLIMGFMGDYRTAPLASNERQISEWNYGLHASLDLKFPKGFNLILFDEYAETRFDHTLYEESGTSRAKSNDLGAKVKYAFVERLKFEGKYVHGWEQIKDPNRVVEERDSDTLEARLNVPVLESTSVYGKYRYKIVESDTVTARNYERVRLAAGLKWKGVYRFYAWGEIGKEEVDFESPLMKDYDNVAAEIGLGIRFTDNTTSEVSVGQDGFGNTTLAAWFEYDSAPQEFVVRLSGRRETRVSFSTQYPSGELIMHNLDLELVKENIISRFTLTLNANYQTQEAYTADRIINDRIYTGRVQVDYPVQDWLRLGAHGQYSQRISDDYVNEYENKRLGVFVAFMF